MKIGIITIIDDNNYGNRLQNYALQYALEKMGVESETIINLPYYDLRHSKNWKTKLRNLERTFRCLPIICHYTEKKELSLFYSRKAEKFVPIERKRLFDQFDTKIKFWHSIIGFYDSKKVKKEFDKFIVGSDQVWNCLMWRASGVDFLQFADSKQRIAYAASISLDRIPEAFLHRYKMYLKNFPHISVRETQAVNLLKEQLGIVAERVLDPTLLVDVNHWREIALEANIKVEKKYVILMMLGSKTSENMELIVKYAKDNSLEIIELNNPENEYYSVGPTEFLWLIMNSECVFTDSFHCSVFSILFRKQFYVSRRKGDGDYMYSRLDSLLSMFKLTGRELTSQNLKKYISEREWDICEEILFKERINSEKYLNRSIFDL